MRSPFFLSSGFTAQDIVNMVESKKDNRLRLEKIRQRKQMERRQIKWIKQARVSNEALRIIIRTTKKVNSKMKTDPIQYGLDIAAWWNEQHE